MILLLPPPPVDEAHCPSGDGTSREPESCAGEPPAPPWVVDADRLAGPVVGTRREHEPRLSFFERRGSSLPSPFVRR